MAVLKQMNPTLADVMARTGADGKLLTVVELLNETNEVLDDLVMIEANGTTAHKTTIRSGLPEATWRMFYQGVQPSKSTVLSISDAIGMLEAYAELETRIGSAGCAQRIAEQLYTTLQQLIQETEKRPTTC